MLGQRPKVSALVEYGLKHCGYKPAHATQALGTFYLALLFGSVGIVKMGCAALDASLGSSS